jgi:hypothetical protein
LLVAGTFVKSKEDSTMRSDRLINSALHAVTSHEADVYLTPKQPVERATEREAGAKWLPPGKVREWVVQEVQRARDCALAEINQSLYQA